MSHITAAENTLNQLNSERDPEPEMVMGEAQRATAHALIAIAHLLEQIADRMDSIDEGGIIVHQ